MNPSISTEQININNKSKLGDELLPVVAKLARQRNTGEFPNDAGMQLSDVIKRNTQLNITVDFIETGVPFAAVMTNVAGQHSSVNRRVEKSIFDKDPGLLKYVNGTVDLENVKVDGSFKDVPAKIEIDKSVLDKLTDPMIVAGILHEVGHVFWSFATIGDYVWMSYYLQEGIEVMLGNKPNRYRIKTMTVEELKKSTDEASRRRLKEGVTPTTLRRAVIGLYTDTNRGFVSSVSDSSTLKRDEQLADWFVSRLGYGLPLAQYIRLMVVDTKSKREAWIREIALIPTLLIPGINIATITWATVQFMNSSDIRSSYDSPIERIRKMRRDSISQLSKVTKDPKRADKLLRDIKAFDKLIEPLYDVPNALDIVGMVISPSHRRNAHHLRLERQLETFLNNDLFVVHSKLRQYSM